MGNKLPKNWVETELGVVGDIVTGNTPSKKHSEYYDGEIPWIKPGDIRTGIELFDSVETLTEEGSKNARMLPKGAVMVTCIGNLGNIAIAGKEMATNQQINSVVFSKYVDDKFGYYACNLLKPWLVENSTSTTISMVNKSIFKKAPFPLPPLVEQQRIVAKLDQLFTHLETLKTRLNHIPQLLKNFRQAVLTQAVTGKLTEEWRVGMELEEWKEVELGKVGSWKGGGTPSKSVKKYWLNGNVLWITPKDMKSLIIDDSIDKITEESVENSSANYIDPNSILIVTRSGILRRILPISMNSSISTVNQDIKALTPNNEFNSKFLLYILRGLEENIRATCMKSGTTVESVEFSSLKKYAIKHPPKQEQTEIVKRVEALFAKADTIETQYQSLKTKIDSLPQAILAKAFKGELVAQLESDGDAKELLREIQRLKAELKPVRKTVKRKKKTTK